MPLTSFLLRLLCCQFRCSWSVNLSTLTLFFTNILKVSKVGISLFWWLYLVCSSCSGGFVAASYWKGVPCQIELQVLEAIYIAGVILKWNRNAVVLASCNGLMTIYQPAACSSCCWCSPEILSKSWNLAAGIFVEMSQVQLETHAGDK
ncbi:uncharacterized protein LOC124311476 isoform X2 [Daphnia pulicaria]|uniref:uncharacterized protein LOC124311476 isoform X2 n=1 Tax=Daphnia pulicaria TaxID=35523 RepID=UPI001EEA5D62|nr:uncharacterized protein LOC124311476 isoform X2 [Daphnia pulicaria]